MTVLKKNIPPSPQSLNDSLPKYPLTFTLLTISLSKNRISTWFFTLSQPRGIHPTLQCTHEEGGFCRVYAAFLCEDHANAQEGNFSFSHFVFASVENFLSVFVGRSFAKVWFLHQLSPKKFCIKQISLLLKLSSHFFISRQRKYSFKGLFCVVCRKKLVLLYSRVFFEPNIPWMMRHGGIENTRTVQWKYFLIFYRTKESALHKKLSKRISLTYQWKIFVWRESAEKRKTRKI